MEDGTKIFPHSHRLQVLFQKLNAGLNGIDTRNYDSMNALLEEILYGISLPHSKKIRNAID